MLCDKIVYITDRQNGLYCIILQTDLETPEGEEVDWLVTLLDLTGWEDNDIEEKEKWLSWLLLDKVCWTCLRFFDTFTLKEYPRIPGTVPVSTTVCVTGWLSQQTTQPCLGEKYHRFPKYRTLIFIFGTEWKRMEGGVNRSRNDRNGLSGRGVVYYKSKARAKESIYKWCRYNERLNSETEGSKTPHIHWVALVNIQ
jgi:hypothetical protein